jgi:hypothetical protein
LGPVPNFIEKSRKLLGISKIPDLKMIEIMKDTAIFEYFII